MRSQRSGLFRILVILGLMFGFMGTLSVTETAAQGVPTVCQYTFDFNGNVTLRNEQPSAEACAILFANSTTCTAVDTNGNGVPDTFTAGGGCVVEQNPGIACMIVDNDGDGNIDSVKGCPPAQVTPTETPVTPTETPVTPTETPVTPTETPVTPTETPVTPTETPVTPTETPVTPTETPVTPTETPVTPTETPVTPTETPDDDQTKTPTETPDDDQTKTPTETKTPDDDQTKTPDDKHTKTPGDKDHDKDDDGGKADPDDKHREDRARVDELPTTGQGPDSGSGTGLAILLGAMSALMLAGGLFWQRRGTV